ncbi:hypothetical protein QR685DRAFT_541150 [Neurospora intermedia]|uniref:Uncharacterized protein n=1 Tax=Neurospora intermedia TaxID=5142 RepID=A0ABR3DTE0_NEUIN
MSRDKEARRKGAEEWSKLLMDNHVNDKESVTEVLQNLAEEFSKRVAPVWNSDSQSIAWRNYFFAALNGVLRELPPVDLSIEELRKKIEDMKLERTTSPVEAAALIHVNVANAISTDSSAEDAKIADDTTFKVDTQGDYTARIVKDGTTTTLEFQLNGPATVVVQSATTAPHN